MRKTALALLARIGTAFVVAVIGGLIYYGCFRAFLSARFFLHETVWTNRIADSPVTVGLAFYFICFTLVVQYWKSPLNFLCRVFENFSDKIDRWDLSRAEQEPLKQETI
jgi:hypothetical protein